jgi:hypothetical protein
LTHELRIDEPRRAKGAPSANLDAYRAELLTQLGVRV